MTDETVPTLEELNAPPAFSIVERVRFGDLDAMQHLNNVEFLRYFETARIVYLQDRLPEHDPTKRHKFGWILAECHIDYRAPGFFDDRVRVFIRPGALERSSIELRFEMRRDGDERLLAEGYGVMVGYDYDEGAAARIPAEVRQRLEADAA